MFSQVRTHFRGLPPPLLLLVLLALVLHGGRVVSAAAAEEHEDEEGETAEGWDDVLDALEPFHKEKGELCAACSFVAGRINAKWTGNILRPVMSSPRYGERLGSFGISKN